MTMTPGHHDQAAPELPAATELLPVDGPVPPESMTPDEVESTRAQAVSLVEGVRDSSGGRRLAVLDEITSVGVQSQRNAGRQLELVNTRIGMLLTEGGASNAVATDLVELRGALEKIDPHLQQRSLWARTTDVLPFVRNNALVRSLKKIAMRYEPVSKQIAVIESKLREGRTLLQRDNIELRKLYEDVEAQQVAIKRQSYFGELIVGELTVLYDETADPRQRDTIQAAVHDVATRVQDLRVMDEVHHQYFLSIELTRQNNNRLGQAVDRTLTLATNVVTVGLAIQAALVRQQRVQEAAARTREFLGTMITQNAAAIRAHTEQIGDLYNQPVIAIDALAQAHDDLLAALDLAGRLREEGIRTAQDNAARIASMTVELDTRLQGLEDTDRTR